MSDDEFILTAALRSLQKHLDEFVGACMSEDGKPKTPDGKALARIRGYLTPACRHAYK